MILLYHFLYFFATCQYLEYNTNMKTKLLIEQHFHGAFGVNFNDCTADDILYLSKEITKYGIGGIFPTLATDTVENIKNQINKIKQAAKMQTSGMAKIFGVHLEGIFLNPEKKGIHDEKLFLKPTIENYKLIEDDFIKILTYAPEFDENFALAKYLLTKDVKIQAGHCTGGDLSYCDGATHLFNAMSGIVQRGTSTALTALTDDSIYTEIIADGVHISDSIIRLIFKAKPIDKILLISDCLPITKSNLKEMEFEGETIYFDGEKATSKDGTLAGSTKLLPDIIKRLGLMGLFTPQLIENTYAYHNIDLTGGIEWDEHFNIVKVDL